MEQRLEWLEPAAHLWQAYNWKTGPPIAKLALIFPKTMIIRDSKKKHGEGNFWPPFYFCLGWHWTNFIVASSLEKVWCCRNWTQDLSVRILWHQSPSKTIFAHCKDLGLGQVLGLIRYLSRLLRLKATCCPQPERCETCSSKDRSLHL